jgi:hypothetical protein
MQKIVCSIFLLLSSSHAIAMEKLPFPALTLIKKNLRAIECQLAFPYHEPQETSPEARTALLKERYDLITTTLREHVIPTPIAYYDFSWLYRIKAQLCHDQPEFIHRKEIIKKLYDQAQEIIEGTPCTE